MLKPVQKFEISDTMPSLVKSFQRPACGESQVNWKCLFLLDNRPHWLPLCGSWYPIPARGGACLMLALCAVCSVSLCVALPELSSSVVPCSFGRCQCGQESEPATSWSLDSHSLREQEIAVNNHSSQLDQDAGPVATCQVSHRCCVRGRAPVATQRQDPKQILPRRAGPELVRHERTEIQCVDQGRE